MSNSNLLIGDPKHIQYMLKSLKMFGTNNDFLILEKNQYQFQRLINNDNSNVCFFNSFSDPSVLRFIDKKKYDYIFVLIIDLKIPQTIINKASLGAFNIHPSLLPDFAGPCPWFWVIKNNVTMSGLTMHVLTEEFDAGDIVAQVKFPLHELETAGTYQEKCKYYLPQLMDKAYENLSHSHYINKKQDRRHYQKKPSDKDCLINWASSAKDVDALVRACNPWFACKAVINSIPCELLEVTITNRKASIPGEIKIINGQLLVSCLDFFVSINIIFKNLEGFFSGKNFVNYTNINES
tara:strand:+ start:481 stop:1362 length:882 start_codon:yes stop_codon:yes gene_type:complete